MSSQEIHFIALDGCINCDSYKSWQENERHPKLQLHESMVPCLLLGCHDYGHTILNPFIGNHELEYVIENKAFPSGKTVTQEMIQNCKKILESRFSDIKR